MCTFDKHMTMYLFLDTHDLAEIRISHSVVSSRTHLKIHFTSTCTAWPNTTARFPVFGIYYYVHSCGLSMYTCLCPKLVCTNGLNVMAVNLWMDAVNDGKVPHIRGIYILKFVAFICVQPCGNYGMI